MPDGKLPTNQKFEGGEEEVALEIVQNHTTDIWNVAPLSNNYMVQYNICVYNRL